VSESPKPTSQNVGDNGSLVNRRAFIRSNRPRQNELAENPTFEEVSPALCENPSNDSNCGRLWMGSVVVKILWGHRIVHNGRPRIRLGAKQRPPSIDFFSEKWIEIKIGGEWR